MTRRYYAPELPVAGGNLTLSEAESRHALRVMRVDVGDPITLFDGCGNESQGTVTQLGRNECHCKMGVPVAVSRELGRSIHLAIALPKPDRARELILRLTELGVNEVTPIVAQRTQRAPTDSLLDRLRRGVIEASKQCGRNVLLKLAPVATVTEFLATNQAGELWIAHPNCGQKSTDVFRKSRNTVVMIGPEGGFNDSEVRQAIDVGYRGIDLGRRIYRVETAATALASILSIEECDP